MTNEKSQIKYGKWSHRLLSIQRAPHASSALVQDVCINHCGPDIFVTKQLLNCSDVITVFQQVSRKAVSKRMTGPVFLDAGGPYSFFHGTESWTFRTATTCSVSRCFSAWGNIVTRSRSPLPSRILISSREKSMSLIRNRTASMILRPDP